MGSKPSVPSPPPVQQKAIIPPPVSRGGDQVHTERRAKLKEAARRKMRVNTVFAGENSENLSGDDDKNKRTLLG
jgi:hypothetical protein